MPVDEAKQPKDFIRAAVAEDVAQGRTGGALVTRFPPEPNGFLHIGHAKAICIDFGIASEFGGRCHLRFDDTNPLKEEQKYAQAIKEDLRWLGFDWGDHLYYTSDYFAQLYEWAVLLIKAGKAYVDDQSVEDIRSKRGTLKEPGEESPFRNRPVDENLDLFERMKKGEFPNGSKVLRARIDMASPNLNLRDPVMYRILHATHPHAGDTWKIYPMYDWAHGQSDWIEGITHSLCSLEFEDHRPLYEWYINQIDEAGGRPEGVQHKPRQIEFARLNLSYTLMSKRKLLQLVNEGRVSGWDDPRMPTLRGMRRRGYTPEAIRNLCDCIGVTKYNSTTELALLEHFVREDLNKRAERRMAVMNPLEVTITNWPDGDTDELEAVNNPEDESAGTRAVTFGKTLYIERDDFMEDPPRKFFRLGPGREVRLRYAYFITCDEVIKDDDGDVVELKCSYDPETRGGDAPDGRKVKGTLHWVSAAHAVEAEVRLFDHLFTKEDPEDVEEGRTFLDNLNPESLKTQTAYVEPSLAESGEGERYQFERIGYFCVDADSTPGRPVFNRTVSLKDSWAKQQKKQQQQQQHKSRQ